MSSLSSRIGFTARALLAVCMLAGYYLLSLVIAAIAIAAIVLMAWSGSRWGFGYLIAVLTAGLSLWTAARVFFEGGKEGELPGITLSRADAPALFDFVDEVAAKVGTRPPVEIRLCPDANAFVTERGGFMGFGRRRILALGYLDLRRSNRSEIVATLAHELGHFAGGDTFLGPMTHRAHYVVLRSTGLVLDRAASEGDHFSLSAARAFIGAALRAYGTLVLRVSLGVARRQELAADTVAVRLAGKIPHLRSLERMGRDITTFGLFLRREVAPLVEAKRWPLRFWDGYDLFEQATRDEVAAIVRSHEPDPYDTHPTDEARIAHAHGLGLVDPEEDTRPALDLLADPAALWDRLEDEMGEGCETIEWSETAAIFAAETRKNADEAYRAFSWLAPGSDWTTMARTLLYVIATEGPHRLLVAREPMLGQVTADVFRAATGPVIAGSVGAIVAIALAVEHGYRFEAPVGRSLVLVRGEAEVEPMKLVVQAATGQSTVALLDSLLAMPRPAPAA